MRPTLSVISRLHNAPVLHLALAIGLWSAPAWADPSDAAAAATATADSPKDAAPCPGHDRPGHERGGHAGDRDRGGPMHGDHGWHGERGPRGLSDLGGPSDCDDCDGPGEEAPCDCPDCRDDRGGHGGRGDHGDARDARDPGRGPPRAGHLPPPVGALMRHVLGKMPRMQALLQTQAALWTGADAQIARGDRAEVMGFGMRRARMGLEGGMGRYLSYGVSVDLAPNPQTSGGALAAAWFAVKPWRTGELVVGAQRTPFLREAMLSAGHLALAERSISANAMAPYRQVGVTLAGHYDLAGLEWYLGAYNGFERGDNFYQGFRQLSGSTGNRFGGIAAVARLSAAPMGDMGPEVYDAKGGDLRVAVGASGYTSDAGTTRMNGVSADLHLKLKGAHLLVQYLRDMADPKEKPSQPATIPASITRQSVLAEVGYSWRRLNGAVRYERIDPDTSREDDMDGQVFSGALGVQLPRDRMRVQLQFDHRQEGNGSALDNDVLFAMFQLML